MTQEKANINVDIERNIKLRIDRINYLYRFYLLNLDSIKAKQELIDGIQILDLKDKDLEVFYDLLDKNNLLIEKIEPILASTWKWKRISNIKKAILVNGAYEILFTDIPKAVVIDQSLYIARLYEFEKEDDIKFINSCLDKID